MGRVYIAVDIHFKCRVHGNHLQPLDNAGMIGNFLGPQYDPPTLIIHIFRQLFELFRHNGQGSDTSSVAYPCLEGEELGRDPALFFSLIRNSITWSAIFRLTLSYRLKVQTWSGSSFFTMPTTFFGFTWA
jgi:hypothetical protein